MRLKLKIDFRALNIKLVYVHENHGKIVKFFRIVYLLLLENIYLEYFFVSEKYEL